MGFISSLKLFVVLLACSLACTARAQVNYLTILAFGDSITQGFARDADGEEYGILEPPRGARIDWWGYEIKLEYMLEHTLGTGTSSIYNWGYHGLRSDSALRCDQDWDCIDDVLASREADMILILLGANDPYDGISASTTKYNLSEMIDKSRARGVVPVLGTITPNSSDEALFDPALINKSYNPLIRDLAEEKKVPLAEHYEAMDQNWDLLYTSGDGLHLNDEPGNKKLAQNWHKAIIKYLTDPDPEPEPEPVILSPILYLLLNDS
ncbi:MAG: GDSL-type esterase/lipase family protein [Thermodesulfobacteriota bacterium]|nr:GDSL-type esterase/lipase family protein [Thermodesulfobacteriota bacterium]